MTANADERRNKFLEIIADELYIMRRDKDINLSLEEQISPWGHPERKQLVKKIENLRKDI